MSDVHCVAWGVGGRVLCVEGCRTLIRNGAEDRFVGVVSAFTMKCDLEEMGGPAPNGSFFFSSNVTRKGLALEVNTGPGLDGFRRGD